MLQQVVPRQENYTQSRAVALHNVESTISELSGIFTHLATMVAQQGELAIRFACFAPICDACIFRLTIWKFYFVYLDLGGLGIKMKTTETVELFQFCSHISSWLSQVI